MYLIMIDKKIFQTLPTSSSSAIKNFIIANEKNGHTIHILEINENEQDQINNLLEKEIQTSKGELIKGTFIYKVGSEETTERNYKNIFIRTQALLTYPDAYWDKQYASIHALDTITRFVKVTKSYHKITSSPLMSVARNKLIKQRFALMKEETTTIQDSSTIQDINLFLNQWGQHIAPVQQLKKTKIKNLNTKVIHSETQDPYESFYTDAHYYRINGFVDSPLADKYMNKFIQQYEAMHNIKISPELCLPIDRDFSNLKELLGIENYKILTIPLTTNSSTKNHSIIVVNNEQEKEDLQRKMFAAGLMPTALKLAEFNCANENKFIFTDLSLPKFNLNYHANINTLNDFLTSKGYKNFKKLCQFAKLNMGYDYINIYVNAIDNLLTGLNTYINENADKISKDKHQALSNSYQIMTNYLEWISVYYKDHRRMGNFFEWIMEEIFYHLILLKPYTTTDFDQIIKDQLLADNNIKNICDENNIEFSIGLYNSGMRSFYEVISACKVDAKIVYIDNNYFELKDLLKKGLVTEENFNEPLKNADADIYIANLQAVVAENKNEIYAIDPQELIDEIFAKRNTIDPVTVVLDGTITDLSNAELKYLISQNSEKIRQGKLNIVFAQSLQKFGMLGTDKVQAGCIIAANNPLHFPAFNKMIRNPDFHNHAHDIQYICHLFKFAHSQIQQTFDLIARNAEILRQNDSTHLAINYPKNSPFVLYEHKANKKAKIKYGRNKNYFNNIARKALVQRRASFGFYHAANSTIKFGKNYFIRVIPGHESIQKTKEISAYLEYIHSLDNSYFDFPPRSILAIVRKLAKLLKIPSNSYGSFAYHISVINKYLEKNYNQFSIHEHAAQLLPLLMHLYDYYKIKSTDFHEKVLIFNLINILIRKYKLKLSAEFQERFILIIYEIKNKLMIEINKIQGLTRDVLFNYLFKLTTNKNGDPINLTVNLRGIFVFHEFLEKQRLSEKFPEAFHLLLRHIYFYLQTKDHHFSGSFSEALLLFAEMKDLTFEENIFDHNCLSTFPEYLKHHPLFAENHLPIDLSTLLSINSPFYANNNTYITIRPGDKDNKAYIDCYFKNQADAKELIDIISSLFDDFHISLTKNDNKILKNYPWKISFSLTKYLRILYREVAETIRILPDHNRVALLASFDASSAPLSYTFNMPFANMESLDLSSGEIAIHLYHYSPRARSLCCEIENLIVVAKLPSRNFHLNLQENTFFKEVIKKLNQSTHYSAIDFITSLNYLKNYLTRNYVTLTLSLNAMLFILIQPARSHSSELRELIDVFNAPLRSAYSPDSSINTIINFGLNNTNFMAPIGAKQSALQIAYEYRNWPAIIAMLLTTETLNKETVKMIDKAADDLLNIKPSSIFATAINTDSKFHEILRNCENGKNAYGQFLKKAALTDQRAKTILDDINMLLEYRPLNNIYDKNRLA